MEEHPCHATYIALGDLHLYPGHCALTSVLPVLHEIVGRLEDREELTLVLMGDVFDFSMAMGGKSISIEENALQTIRQLNTEASAFFDALYEIIEAKGSIILLFGNHDEELHFPSVQKAFVDCIDMRGPARRQRPEALDMKGWFFRPQGASIHFEHGNQYDPDNAVPHPLTLIDEDGQLTASPLGNMLSRHFASRLADIDFSLKSDHSPLLQAWNVLHRHQWRLHSLAWSFARTVRLTKHHSKYIRLPSPKEYERREQEYAHSHQLSPETIQRVREQMATPTIISPRRIHRRLFLDELYLSGVTLLLLCLGFLYPKYASFLFSSAFAFAGSLALYSYWRKRRKVRAARLLAEAGQAISAHTDVELVVMGHAHVNDQIGPYINTGSLCYPRPCSSRSFLEISSHNGQLSVQRRLQP